MPTRSGTFHSNGIDGASGDYLLPPLTAETLSRAAQGAVRDLRQTAELAERRNQAAAHLALSDAWDPSELAEAGWGVIFAAGADPGLRQALAPLIEHRQAQAAAKDGRRFRIFEGSRGYRPGLTKNQFLVENGEGPAGPANPDRMPYYLLLVGSPEIIPFGFQYQLDVKYAVGRLHLDSLDDYAFYARGVVAAETGKVVRPRRAALFGPRNADDEATGLSCDCLLAGLQQRFAAAPPAGWEVSGVLGKSATKARLAGLIGGAQTPALLFTASHGVAFPADEQRQARHQGALLCQDWPGPFAHRGPLPEEFYFSADDVDDSGVAGLVAFHFACYSAGTPQFDDFSRDGAGRRQLAPHAFVSPLARRLLARGALAVIGHIDKAWGYSFYWPDAGGQIEVFHDALTRLMRGRRAGFAMEPFNMRHSELATDLRDELDAIGDGKKPDDPALALMWTADNDARNYALMGDPAVRLAFV